MVETVLQQRVDRPTTRLGSAIGLMVATWLGCGVNEIARAPAIAPPADPSSHIALPVDAAPPSSLPPPVSDGAVGAGPVESAAAVGTSGDAPAALGAGVVLGGVLVPRNKVVVFLHIGHSNMAGRATGPPQLRSYFYDTNPHLWAYAAGGAWHLAKEPLSGDMATGNAAGPGMAILHAALNAAPDAYFVSIGHGQSGLAEGDCASYRKGGVLYDIVMGPARELKGVVTFGGIFTMLGITEHHLAVAQQQGFSDCMKGLADDMRGDLGEPDVPFIVGGYELGATRPDVAPSTAFAKLIIAQIELIPGKTTHAAIIPTDGLPMQDNHHYDMTGHKLWAERGMHLLIDHGWAPWAGP